MSRATQRSTRYAFIAAAMMVFATSVQAQDLPKGADVLKKSVDAMGGEAALRKRSESHMTGTFEMPAMGVSGTLEVFASSNPNRMLTVVDIPGLGSVRTGFDGTTAWTINPATGTMLLSGKQLQQATQQADQLAMLTPDKYFKSIETVEQTTFAGKDVYKVQLTTNWDESYHEYYDVSTGLQVGATRTNESEMGPIEVVTTIDEWKEFNGIKVPVVMRQAMMGMEQTMKVNTVEFSIADPKVFDVPAEVKALIK